MESCKKKISFLLGAGFSAPMKYPTGTGLNKKIASVDAGILAHLNLNDEYSQQAFENFLKLKEGFYTQNIDFDYEEFYDCILDKKRFKQWVKPKNLENEQYQVQLFYHNMVSLFIKDSYNRQYYDCTLQEGEYKGFLDLVMTLQKKYELKFHTLNHDLLLEGLLNKRSITYSDGFTEIGSPYYGKICRDNLGYTCRLEQFKDLYKEPNGLYKLHGSIDYYIYYTNPDCFVPDNCIKNKKDVKPSSFKKDTNKGDYERTFNEYPNFLTGKKKNYTDPILYSKLTAHFKQNLQNSEILIVIGYGCKDSKINEFIKNNFSKGNECFIVDKDPNIVNKFQQETSIEAQYIDGLENIGEILKNINQNIV